MTSPDRDLEDLLRRALHAAVDSIEPASDGLDRIRGRAAAPRWWRQAQLLLTECLDLIRLAGVRLESAAVRAGTPAGQARRRAGASRPAAVPVLAARRAGAWAATAFALLRKLAAGQRAGEGNGEQRPAERFRPVAWLRPALVVAGTVFIVVAGVYGVSQLKQTVTTIGLLRGDSPSSSPGAPTPQASGNAPVGSASPSKAAPSSHSAPHQRAHATPQPTCSKRTGSGPSTPATPVTSPPVTPTVSPTPSVTPSPSGTDSSSSSSNATSADSGAPAASEQGAQLTADCVTSSATPPARGSASSLPSP
jgi:hypothetical protein